MNAIDSTPGERASRAQLVASDPEVSAFVAASAGSGKTKLLTDRLLRLMLAGADPARIQCLTYTKAGAAEMALRLRRTLGEWVTLDDLALDQRLRQLAIAPGEASRAAARALFARVLDLPGGMRIGTIHSFCQSLLRRFPLEARLSPHFRVADDVESGGTLLAAGESVLDEAHTEIQRRTLMQVAPLVTARQFNKLTASLQTDRARLELLLRQSPDTVAALLRRLLDAPGSEAEVLAASAEWPGERALVAALRELRTLASDAVKLRAEQLLDWLSDDVATRPARWPEWARRFLNADGQPCAAKSLVNDKLAGSRPDLRDAMLAEQARVFDVAARMRAARHAEAAIAMLALTVPVTQGYANGKAAAGQLDYADLVTRTLALLHDPGAAWVLFKLDGGLDHMLLDEVQDTAPAQWDIAGALTAEFHAGAGAHEDGARKNAPPRTVFAVGDRKQSIFSFQGAEPAAFDAWRDRLGQRVRAAGERWENVALDVSFRSTAAVLQLVDAVFSHPDAAAGVTDDTLHHRVHRAGHAGRVTLWPLVPRPEPLAKQPWVVPERNFHAVGAQQQLAEQLAGWIARETSGGTMLESRGRPLAPGDVLVLVRKRDNLGRTLVRALKALGVPVAGLDRMLLTAQPAVADMLALCDALLLPEDDLALACVLTSPLGNLSPDSLEALATGAPLETGRRGRLIEALRHRARERADWRAANDFVARLLARVDFAPPHAILAEALGPLGGRARLLGRLGQEAAEPLDELLSSALAFAASRPPSLQGFLHWLRQSAAEVKREPEAAGNAVRIMTVHGAKGLQAPLVILPDTTTKPDERETWLWSEVDGPDGRLAIPVWSANKDLRGDAAQVLHEREQERSREEHNRLLYVALTRAEDRLLVCGYTPHHGAADGSWYKLIAGGFATLDPPSVPFEGWDGEARELACAQTVAPAALAAERALLDAVPLPDWAGQAPLWQPRPAPVEPPLPARLAPSRPADAQLGPVPPAAAPFADRAAGTDRFQRGQIMHALLQHLPDLPLAARAQAARGYLSRPGIGLDADEIEATLADLASVLEHPDLAPLFAPGSRAEVPLTGVVAGTVVSGIVDRLAVLPDRVLVADYKTNRLPPDGLDAVPVLYLRQMAAYRAVLRAAFPGRGVACALVWTSGAVAMPLPDAWLDPHAPLDPARRGPQLPSTTDQGMHP